MYQKVTVNSYTLFRSRRATIAVEIHPNMEVVVRAPIRTPQHEIDIFLENRSAWIADRLERTRQILHVLPSLELPGSFHHRGEARVWQGALASLNRWERTEASRVLSTHIADLLPALGVAGLRYAGLKLRRMRRRWGSCSITGTIVLNTFLVRVPDRCSKAVVAHELAHLVHMHHGREFKALVTDLYPEYIQANKELDLWTSILSNDGSTGRRVANRERSEQCELRLHAVLVKG